MINIKDGTLMVKRCAEFAVKELNGKMQIHNNNVATIKHLNTNNNLEYCSFITFEGGVFRIGITSSLCDISDFNNNQKSKLTDVFDKLFRSDMSNGLLNNGKGLIIGSSKFIIIDDNILCCLHEDQYLKGYSMSQYIEKLLLPEYHCAYDKISALDYYFPKFKDNNCNCDDLIKDMLNINENIYKKYNS